MSLIHPTAVVHRGVEIDEGAWIGPYVVIGRPGESRKEPIHRRAGGRVIIGANAEIHEFARIQSGISGITRVGDGLLMMAGAHVGNDAQIGRNVTLSSSCVVGGHSVLEDYVNVGLGAVLHQRSNIRRGAMIGAQAFHKGDTDEWEIGAGVPARVIGINEVGKSRWLSE